MKRFLSQRGFAALGSIATVAVIGIGLYVSDGIPGVYFCDGRPMTAAQVAARRGIDPALIEQLHFNRSLDVSQVCTMPQKKLERAMYKLTNPTPDHPGEWAKLRAKQSQDENGKILPDGLVKAKAHIDEMQAFQSKQVEQDQVSKTSWTWIGPGNIGGRIRSILTHPTNANILYVASVSGGIWRTTNGGTSWAVLNDFMSNMAVSAMVMDRVNANIIYAGTGEGFFNVDRITGAGIFKTTNGGSNWAQLASTNNANFQFVNRLAISKNNATILAATGTGIFRSTNAGGAWSQRLAGNILDVQFHPTDNTKAVASSNGGVSWYSTDGGLTWHTSTGINSTGGFNNRVEIAYAPSNGSIVYASSGYNNGTLYRSTNGGQTFSQANTGNAYLGSQGWYANALWVDPKNPSIVVVGGLDIWRSTNNGSTLTKISQWFSAPSSAHADHHIIVNAAAYNGSSNNTVYFGNDGGIYKAANVKTVSLVSGWQELNNNLGITQFYGAAGNPSTNEIIGGTQDNGTLFFTPAQGPQNWTAPFGGDGGWAAADPTNVNYFYGEYVYLQIHRSSNRGVSSSYIYNGITDANACALFIAPFVLDPNNANTMLAGGCSLWRSTNVKAGTPTWKKIKTASGRNISAIAVEPGNSNVVWVGYDNGDVFRSTNGTAASPTWVKVDGTLPNRYITRITIQKNTPAKVYVTLGGFFDGNTTGNVWRTANGTAGAPTWTNIHGSGATGLPAVPIRDLVIHPSNANVLYVGTDSGIFVSSNGGTSWTLPTSGPTNTAVDQLFFLGTTIYAATHGRGLFKSATLPVPVQTPVAEAEATSTDSN